MLMDVRTIEKLGCKMMVEDRIYTTDGYKTGEIPDMGQTIKALESKGFYVQKVHDSVGRGVDFSIVGNNTLDDFISLAQKVNATIVMIDECYLDKDAYIMEFDLDEDTAFLQKDIDEFNKSLDSIKFEKPYDVFIYFFYEGLPFGVRFQNTELVELASLSSRDRFMEFQERHEEDVRKVIEERKRKARELEDSLLETIANDPEFQMCTNQASRVDFMKRFIERNENKEAKEILSSGYGYVPQNTLKGFGDRAWALYKSRKG